MNFYRVLALVALFLAVASAIQVPAAAEVESPAEPVGHLVNSDASVADSEPENLSGAPEHETRRLLNEIDNLKKNVRTADTPISAEEGAKAIAEAKKLLGDDFGHISQDQVEGAEKMAEGYDLNEMKKVLNDLVSAREAMKLPVDQAN